VLIAAMGFTCVNLVRRRECVAVLASGVSLHRLFVPFLAVALLVTAAQAIDQEILIPRVAHKLFRDHESAGQNTSANLRVPLIADSANRLWYAVNYDSALERMDNVSVWERDDQGSVTCRITADSATWTGAEWSFENGTAETPDGERTPIDNIATDLDPTGVLIKRIEGFGQNLSWRQISAALNQPVPVSEKTRRDLNTIRYGRIAVMCSNLLVLCINLPFFLMREPKGMLKQTLKCAPIGGIAIIGTILAVAAPPPGLPVWVGALIPILILTPIAIATASSLRTYPLSTLGMRLGESRDCYFRLRRNPGICSASFQACQKLQTNSTQKTTPTPEGAGVAYIADSWVGHHRSLPTGSPSGILGRECADNHAMDCSTLRV